jgi:glycosyltransferase involved in cell wall biosynthesis
MRRLAFVWDNFGFMHNERLDALGRELGAAGEVIGIELFSTSTDYGWGSEQPNAFRKITLFRGRIQEPPTSFAVTIALVRACLKARADTVFMCGHGLGGIFLASVLLRLLGRRLVVLSDTKFDDRPRSSLKELAKALYYAPYRAALVPSRRSIEYFRFVGFRKRPVELFYYNRPLARIRAAAEAPPAPAGVPHADRAFLCVARLVEKKNHSMLLRAYALYARASERPRPLVLCGSGPLEEELRALAAELAITHLVEFRGWQSEAQVAQQLARTLALVLCSTEEQFGIAVIEGLAMGVPAIVSENVGARDLYVRTGVNGFLVEPDNPEGLAYMMQLLDTDEALWTRMAHAATERAAQADVSLFVQSALSLAR